MDIVPPDPNGQQDTNPPESNRITAFCPSRFIPNSISVFVPQSHYLSSARKPSISLVRARNNYQVISLSTPYFGLCCSFILRSLGKPR